MHHQNLLLNIEFVDSHLNCWKTDPIFRLRRCEEYLCDCWAAVVANKDFNAIAATIEEQSICCFGGRSGCNEDGCGEKKRTHSDSA
mgnify:CR=1 FL=1